MFKEKVEIHIFEGNTVGGRLSTSKFALLTASMDCLISKFVLLTVGMTDGIEYETGGSIIHERNKYMSDFVKDLGDLQF